MPCRCEEGCGDESIIATPSQLDLYFQEWKSIACLAPAETLRAQIAADLFRVERERVEDPVGDGSAGSGNRDGRRRSAVRRSGRPPRDRRTASVVPGCDPGDRSQPAIDPGRVKTFFLPQKLHAAGRNPRRRDRLSLFLLYRVRSQSGLVRTARLAERCPTEALGLRKDEPHPVRPLRARLEFGECSRVDRLLCRHETMQIEMLGVKLRHHMHPTRGELNGLRHTRRGVAWVERLDN
ncbi:MAG: hypothetical protein JWR49_1323 [Tardiphaga sp.]|nr:hypothetical protein [Tardiphaga sp.]